MNRITGIRIEREEKRRGDLILCLETAGGNIYLRKSTLEAAGGSWRQLAGRARQQAAAHGIPLTDETRAAGSPD